jgi:DNA-binding NarL/FixJ family response regulator
MADECMNLSRAEREVALALCRGLTDKEVAESLFRSYHTVRTQKKAIYRKVGVTKDTELMAAMICERKRVRFSIRRLRAKGVELYDEEL